MKTKTFMLVFSYLTTTSLLAFGNIETITGIHEISETGQEYIRWNTPGGMVQGEVRRNCLSDKAPGVAVVVDMKCISTIWVLEHRESKTQIANSFPVHSLPAIEKNFEYLQIGNRIVRIRTTPQNHRIFDTAWPIIPRVVETQNNRTLGVNAKFIRELDSRTWLVSGTVVPTSESKAITLRVGTKYLRVLRKELERLNWKKLQSTTLKFKINKDAVLAMWEVPN